MGTTQAGVNGVATITFPVRNLSAGSHTVYLRGTDTAGRPLVTAATFSVVLPRTGPTAGLLWLVAVGVALVTVGIADRLTGRTRGAHYRRT